MELRFREIDESKIISEHNKEISDIHNDISDLSEIQKILNKNISTQFYNINLLEKSTNNIEKETIKSEKTLLETKNIKENVINKELYIILILTGLTIGTPIGFIITTTATGALIGLGTGGILGATFGYLTEIIKK
jgi:hypothetical protein